VKAARKAKKLATKARFAAAEAARTEAAAEAARDVGALPEVVEDAEQRAERARLRAEALKAKKTATEEKKETARDRMWANGGPGVYSDDQSREYLGMLRSDEFATDVIPEIMDGKPTSWTPTSSSASPNSTTKTSRPIWH